MNSPMEKRMDNYMETEVVQGLWGLWNVETEASSNMMVLVSLYQFGNGYLTPTSHDMVMV